MIHTMSRWVDQVFSAAQSRNGGVVRRSLNDVEHFNAYDEIVRRARNKGWHVIETGDQLVVLCHPGDLTIVC